MFRVLAIALATAAALLATASPAAAANWEYFQTDGDRFWDIAAIDRSGNGRWDDVRFDLDNDGPYDTRLVNTRRSDALLEVLDFDMDENGEVEVRMLDGDQRVGFDYVLVDRDQDGFWDPWRGVTRRVVPGSNIDNITRSNRVNASNRLIYDFRQRTGMSLLFPSLPAGY